uniref:Uncharacterized protein n=1 Tax=Anguilla anguilla TaxID=7936 RepID=A0A0E9WH52_ANGAN
MEQPHWVNLYKVPKFVEIVRFDFKLLVFQCFFS